LIETAADGQAKARLQMVADSDGGRTVAPLLEKPSGSNSAEPSSVIAISARIPSQYSWRLMRPRGERK